MAKYATIKETSVQFNNAINLVKQIGEQGTLTSINQFFEYSKRGNERTVNGYEWRSGNCNCRGYNNCKSWHSNLWTKNISR